MPTSDHERLQLEIINELADILKERSNSNILLTGDFNVVLDPNRDRKGYIRDTIPNFFLYPVLSWVQYQQSPLLHAPFQTIEWSEYL